MKYIIRIISLILILVFSISIFITYIVLNINKNTIRYYKHPAKVLGKIQADIYLKINLKR